MSDIPSPKDAARLLASLRRGQELRRIRVAERKLDPQLALLRKWQSKRLARTHADLLASKRYAPAARFFLTDIYAPRDFSQRDQDMMTLYNFMLRFLPPRLLHPLTLTVELYNLTEQLDRALLHVLVDDLGMTNVLTTDLYAEAYRRCDNYDDRRRQIELIVEVGQAVDRLVRLPLVSATLRVAGGPARRAGWHELHDFLERGFKAFKHMRGADSFLRTIRQREMRILDRIFEGDPDPFGFELEVALDE